MAYPQTGRLLHPEQPALDYHVAYSRQALLQTSDSIKEIDFKGHFHPNELVRKVSRELSRLGYYIQLEDLRMERTPVGTSTGQFFGVVHGFAKVLVEPAGRYVYLWKEGLIAMILFGVPFILIGVAGAFIATGLLALVALGALIISLAVLFREKLFHKEFFYNGEIRAEIKVALPGEMYEDFRRDQRMPISTNVSAIVATKLSADATYATPRHLQIRNAARGRDEATPQWKYEYDFWTNKIKDNMDALVLEIELARRELL